MALTSEQIKAGYSTIPGKYDPVTGQLKATTPATPATPNLTPAQISAGYSTIPGPYNPITGQLNAPTPPTPPTDNQSILDLLNAATGATTGGTDYRTQLTDLLNRLTTQNQSYIAALQNQPTAAQQYQTYREQLGLPASEAGLSSTNVQIQKTQGLIDQLEKDINARISGKPITEPLRRRILATEQYPLTEQLGILSRTAGIQQTGVQSAKDQLVQLLNLAAQDQTRQAALAKAPLEMTQSLLPTISSLLQYQSPEEQTSQQIAKEQLMKQLGLGDYAKTASQSDIYGTGIIGEYNFYAAQEKAAGRTPLDFNAYQTQDANRKAIANAAAGGGIDWKTANYITGVDNNFSASPIVKQFNEVQNKYASVKGIIDAGVGGPGDLSLVFEFMKALDPTSVVRESEYAAAAKSGNLFLGTLARFNGYFKATGGFLPPSVKTAFLDIIQTKFNVIQSQYTNLRNEKARLIQQTTGIPDASNYLTDYNFNISIGGTTQGAGTSLDAIKKQYAGQNAFFFKTPTGEIDVEMNLSTSALQDLLNKGYVRIY